MNIKNMLVSVGAIGLALCGLCAFLSFKDEVLRKAVQEKAQKEHEVACSTWPPGVTNFQDAPLPRIVSPNIGGYWVYAKCQKGDWSTVLYYPNEVRIESKRLLALDTLGKETDLGKGVLFSYELILSETHAPHVRKVLRTLPLVDTNVLFKPTSREALAYLRSKKEFAVQGKQE